MNYIYHNSIYHKTNNVVGIVPADEDAKVLDFETNYKSQAVQVDDITIIGTTTFEIEKNYNNFKNLVDGVTIVWGDVKFIKNTKTYDLYLVTDSPL